MKKEEEDCEAAETRKKMLYLASMMAYDDDHEESQVGNYLEKQGKSSIKAQPTAREVETTEIGSDVEDELIDEMLDSAAMFIERSASQKEESQIDVLAEDPKLKRQRQEREQKEQMAKAD